jgi:hypothetical protein
MSKVFVLDSYYKPLDPVHPGWARVLLKHMNKFVHWVYQLNAGVAG